MASQCFSWDDEWCPAPRFGAGSGRRAAAEGGQPTDGVRWGRRTPWQLGKLQPLGTRVAANGTVKGKRLLLVMSGAGPRRMVYFSSNYCRES